jgi:hypothetical protein
MEIAARCSFLLKVAGLHIPGHARKLHHYPINFRRHLHLTSQARCLCQAEGKVQHIILVVIGFLKFVVHVRVLYDDMASRAGTGASAGA